MHQLDYRHIKLIPKKCIVNSRAECDTSVKIKNLKFETPVMLSNMRSVADQNVCREFDKAGWLYSYPRIDGIEDVQSFWNSADVYQPYGEMQKLKSVSLSVGISNEWLEFLKRNVNKRLNILTIDVANSYSDKALNFAVEVKKLFPESYIIFGNGCTPEWVKECYDTKAINCLKLGIGLSKSCRTYEYTGFGSTTVHDLELCITERDLLVNREKLSGVINPHYLSIMADGGITIKGDEIMLGDIAKAIGLGADFVMSGAFVKMCTDSLVSKRGGLYYGNASRNVKSDRIEGMAINVPTNGMTMSEMRKLVKESLQSSISYGGGKCINDIKGKLEYQIVD